MNRKTYLINKRFGRLIVLKHLGNSKWECKCDCGNLKTVTTSHLNGGDTNSCGCYFTELHLKHDRSYTREYGIWKAMKQRCLNPRNISYLNYGGRGISVCDKWLTFEGFWEDMQEGYSDKLTIDRKDNLKGYNKDNCRWATMVEQQNNKTNNVTFTCNGITLNRDQWAIYIGISKETLRSRLRRGWTFENAISQPIDERCHKLGTQHKFQPNAF